MPLNRRSHTCSLRGESAESAGPLQVFAGAPASRLRLVAWPFVAIALTCWVAGCALEPDVGDLQQDRCSDRDTDPDRDVSFRDDIVPLFERTSGGCFQCHDPSSSNPVGVEIGGLDMTSYRSLLAGGARSAGDIVVEGAPCDSVLFLKLTSAPFGSQMPADGPPYWTEPELNLMHDWIAEGAEDN